MVPFLGLVLGPLALVLGILVWRKADPGADERSTGQARAAVILGFFTLITQWTGLILMILGLRSDA